MKFAFFSCQDYTHGYYNALDVMADGDYDFVVCLGDYIYAEAYHSVKGGTGVRDDKIGRENPDNPGIVREAVTLADYRAKYQLYRSDPLLRAVHAKFPMVMLWDDHEVQDNYVGQAGRRRPAGRPSASASRARRRGARRSSRTCRPSPAARGSTASCPSAPTLADFNFAWPQAEVAVMGPEGAVNIIYRRDLASSPTPEERRKKLMDDYKARFANPYSAAERGYIDDVITPHETRPKLINALHTLQTKREPGPKRKHGNIPFNKRAEPRTELREATHSGTVRPCRIRRMWSSSAAASPAVPWPPYWAARAST